MSAPNEQQSLSASAQQDAPAFSAPVAASPLAAAVAATAAAAPAQSTTPTSGPSSTPLSSSTSSVDEARLRASSSVDFDSANAASAAGATSAAGTPTAAAAAAVAAPVSLRGVPAGLKVLVNFRATGSAPIMKKTKFTLSASHRFGMVIEWLRKTLHLKAADPLFVFCNQAFAPNPDSSMHDLFQCYQVQNELVINYAVQEAWG